MRNRSMTTEDVTTRSAGRQDKVLLEVRDLKMHFPVTSGILFQRKIADVKAVDGSVNIQPVGGDGGRVTIGGKPKIESGLLEARVEAAAPGEPACYGWCCHWPPCLAPGASKYSTTRLFPSE